MRRALPAVAGLAVLALATVTACSGDSGKTAASGPPTTDVTVSVTQCGQGWSHPAAGQQHFVLHDTDTRAGEVLLTRSSDGAVYADVEPIGPGTTADLDIDLGSGDYQFRCAMEDEDTVAGPVVTIGGDAKGTAVAVAAVDQSDLLGATKAYENYVKGQIPTLAALTGTVVADVDRGDLAAARTDWLPAHLEYERLGAAYNAFGDLDGRINGTDAGLPGGVDDPGFTGFHRLEYGLWHGQPAAQLQPVAADLSSAVDGLGDEFATAQVDPLDVSIRAHEITENALQFELTGRTDYGSGSNLATVRANLEGTQQVMAILTPLLTGRYTRTQAVGTEITTVEADLDATGYPALSALSQAQRERVDADLSQLSEDLAPIASVLEPRRPS